MARLPDFTALGERPVTRVAAAPAQDSSGQIQAQATGQLGQALSDVAEQVYVQRTNLARAQSANAALDHEIAVKSATQDLADKVQRGEVPYTEAKKQFEDTITKIQPAQVQYLDPVGQQNLKKAAERTVFTEGLKMNEVVAQAERNDFKDQFVQNLDKLGKLAGMPGSNIDEINAKADAFGPLARKAGVPQPLIDKELQDFKDRNWFNNATQVSMQSKDSMPDLKQLEHDLTDADGFYAGKLDTDKRNAVLRTVVNDRLILENRAERLQEKREAAGQRALLQMDTQIASGVPATPAMWANWQSTVKGTEAAPDFKQRMNDETAVQQVLRKPIDEQLKFIQDRESTLESQGGSLRDLANLNRLKGAVQSNVKLMQQEPLIFDANRTGTNVSPINLTALGDPNANSQISAQIQDRMTTLAAMRKQYGNQVPIRPLLPQEAAQLTSALGSASPQQQAQIFGSLRTAAGDDASFKGMMQQIAPDAPVKALAGMLSSKQRNLTLATHWFSPNDVAPSGDVAATMLQGESMLNATKEQKTQDGKPTSKIFLPETTQLQADFQDRVGDAFAGRPGAAETAFQAVQAYYVGKAAQTGRLAASKQDIDSGLVKEAITATLGNVVDFNGKGSVLAPWGMTGGDFEDKAYAALTAAGKAHGLDESDAAALHNVGLKNIGDGTYYAMQGRNFVLDSKGSPIVVNLNDPGNGGPDTTDLRAKAGSAFTDPTTWAKRADGSQKGNGWLGLLRRPDGGVSSEISIGVEINGKEQDIPLLVPTLSRPEVDKLLTLKTDENFNQNLPQSIKNKAVAFARKRLDAGESPFASPDESP